MDSINSVKKYLFVDDRWIASTHAVHRKVPQAVKDTKNPLLVADRPWEGGLNCFGTVLEDAGTGPGMRYRMWYQIYARGRYPDIRFDAGLGYAESADGRIWRKPHVGLATPAGEPSNIVLAGRGRGQFLSAAVLRDPDALPDGRYKLLHWDAMSAADLAAHGDPFPLPEPKAGWQPLAGEGLFTAQSADGLAWRPCHPQPIAGGEVDACAMSRQADGVFAAYFKAGARPERHFRVVARSRSRDFRHWDPPEVILRPDWHDPEGTEFYGMSGFDYFGTRLGLLWVYRNSPDDKRVEVELAAECPNGSWHRAADRRTILPVGGSGAWDAGCIYPASAPVVSPAADPDGLWLYYGGVNVRHDDGRFRENAIGRARLRLDGFAALAAGHLAGELATVPLAELGERAGAGLRVNLHAPRGSLQAVMLDADSGAVLAESATLSGCDATDQPVELSAPPPDGGPRRLLFRLHKAALYSFRFG